jgi:hypothetical protein
LVSASRAVTIADPFVSLVQIGNAAIVVGEKINGEFIMASPCKVFGDRFDVMEQEIVLSSKHTGIVSNIRSFE